MYKSSTMVSEEDRKLYGFDKVLVIDGVPYVLVNDLIRFLLATDNMLVNGCVPKHSRAFQVLSNVYSHFFFGLIINPHSIRATAVPFAKTITGIWVILLKSFHQ